MSKWEMVRLGDVCTPKQWKTVSTSNFTEKGYPIYGANGKIGLYSEFTHTRETILVTCRGATCGNLNICEPYSYVNGNAMALDTLSDDIHLKYLYFYLLNRGFADVISGSAQPQIIKSTLQDINIFVPPLEIQQKIAATLDTAAALLKLRYQQLTELDVLIQSVFVELFGDPVRNTRNLKTEKIEKLCKIIVDCPHSTPKYIAEDSGFKCLRTSNLKRNKINWHDVGFISEEQYNERIKRYEPQKGDIVYSREGAILGIAAMIDIMEKVALGQRLMLLSVDESVCNSFYLCHSLNSEGVRIQVRDKIGGSASPHINVANVKNFKILLPNIQLQTQFAAIVGKIEQQKSLVQQAIDENQTLFDSLMAEYFE